MSDTPYQDTEEFRDRIATVDQDGKRTWIYPKKPQGRFYKWRTWVTWGLLAVLFGLPFIKVNGEPLVLLNILERNFILFGIHFTPQDFHLFVFAMLTLIVFIALFTVVFGRLFCGWVCPQTIFMEMVFRKIEYWIEGDANAQRRLDKQPWNAEKIRKKTLKQGIFILISIAIAHTFLAYIIGIDQVWAIVREPISQNVGGFVAMVAFTGAFYFVFARLREQVCTTICPYGRLQSVLLDKNSIVVAYDFERGEPRGKIRKQKAANPVDQIQQQLGDCIDCKLCVQVCPTGIDIRNGTQLECVNCTACIDACDEVMEKIDRPLGLIRYDSYNGIVEKRNKIFTTRVIAYTVVLVALLVTNFFLLYSRSDVEAVILRTPGMLYQKVDEEHLSNLYNYEFINKTSKDMILEIVPETPEAKIKLVGEMPTVEKNGMTTGAFFIEMPSDALDGRKNTIRLGIYSEGELIETVKTSFLGPGN